MLNQVVIILSAVHLALFIQVPPTWVASTLTRAGTQNVINNILTGNTSSPNVTITFSSGFSAIPNLCYGISRYEANDLLYNEFF